MSTWLLTSFLLYLCRTQHGTLVEWAEGLIRTVLGDLLHKPGPSRAIVMRNSDTKVLHKSKVSQLVLFFVVYSPSHFSLLSSYAKRPLSL